MKGLKPKLRSSRGETLVETLLAILLAAMASLLLAISVNAASRINYDVRQEDMAFRAQLAAAEGYAAEAAQEGEHTITVTVTLEMDDPRTVQVEGSRTVQVEVPVDVYGDAASGELTSYKYTAPPPEEGGDGP